MSFHALLLRARKRLAFKFPLVFSLCLLATSCLAAGESVDLVSAKGTKATAWVTFASPAEGTFTATAKLEGFAPAVSVVTKEPRDPNAFFTDLPGIGEKVPVGVGLAEGAKGAAAKNGEKMTVRLAVPVDAKAPAGLFKGALSVACGGKTVVRELNLKVLDFALPPAKSRFADRPWRMHLGGALPSDWTRETPETYAKNAAAVSSVVGSLRGTKDDLQIERWRTLEVPYYALLDIPYALNPASGRCAAGAKAWLLGFDGVAVPPERKVDPVVAAGLEDAAIDVAYLSYAATLAKELSNRDRHAALVTYEGRITNFWLDRIDVRADDMDVVRLELEARIVRLLAVAKKEGVK